MNDTLYKDLIVPWIPHHERAILQRRDWWLLPIRRMFYDVVYCGLLVDVILHSGSPCDYRFCICRYFGLRDKTYFYRQQSEFWRNGPQVHWSESEEEEEDSDG